MKTDQQLKTWASSQRSQYHKGLLSSRAIAALSALRGWKWRVRLNSGFLPFTDARDLARSLKFTKSSEWARWVGRPMDLPSRPEVSYKTEWAGWPDFLGYDPHFKTTEEWVQIAEKLAENNGGILPLVGLSRYGLFYQMRAYPESFSHIARNRRKLRKLLTPQQVLSKIVQIARDNSGELPSKKRLGKLRGRTYGLINKHRKLFMSRFKKVDAGYNGKWVLK